MASERTQYSTIHCTFLWEEFLGLLGILTKLFFRFEDPYILSGPFDEVDEIDMFLFDSLGRDMKIRESTQWGTHRTAFIKDVWDWVYSQDMTEFVPIVDVFLVGSI
jgi:hypothetical protein